MGVNAEFRRDMQQNLLVLRDQEVNVSMFQEKMLEHNQLEGFLPIRVQRMNGERMIHYDLSGVQPLSEVCHVTLTNVSQLTSLVLGILQVIRKAGEYLLKEDDILLSLEYMFVRLPEYQVKVCYYPGYQIPIKKQISQLFEVLMSCVDYEDRDAVYLMYSLYMKSKDESCTVLDLEQLLMRENTLESGVSMCLKPQFQSQEQSQTIPSMSPQLQMNASKSFNPQMNVSMQINPQKNELTQSQLQVSTFTSEKSQIGSPTQEQPQVHSSIKSSQQKSSNPKKHDISQDIPFAMRTNIMPPELGIGQSVIPRKSVVKEVGETKSNAFRPLISNHREEEKEVWFYPSRCYLFGGLIAILAVLVFGIILKSNILVDPVLKKVEPIKLVAALCIVAMPAFYGIKIVFNPERKVSKFVSVGEYELKEIAATREAIEVEKPKIKMNHGSYGMEENQREILNAKEKLSRGEEVSRRGELSRREEVNRRQELSRREKANRREEGSRGKEVSRWEEFNRREEVGGRKEVNKNVDAGLQSLDIWEEESSPDSKMSSPSYDKRSVGDNRTMLLNGVQATPFAQLISEHPEKADTITLVECPFYIGTVKNQMNYSLSCPVISRYHAKIEKLNGIYYISDLNSTNGTFVNGRRLKAEEPNVLIAGDKVAFANICFIFACPNQKVEIKERQPIDLSCIE